nr:DEAD/DEAH box helicase [Euryarchaeota archaeon]
MAEIVHLDSYEESEVIFSQLSQPVRDWFKDKFPDFTDPQKMAIPSINAGDNLLLCSPTGSGKTLTAFLGIIDKLIRKSLDGELEKKVYCVYISPIKALANDIQKNLIEPLTEIKSRFLPGRAKDIKVGLRTGDTSQSERQKMLRNPPHILITTPESLGLALASSKFRPLMADLSWIILDELHSLVPSKRGTLLSLTMALLDSVITTPVQRIGISATMEPLDEVAKFLVPVGDDTDKVKIAKISGARELDLDIILPHVRFGDPTFDHKQILDANVDRILDLVEAHTTTIVFVNTRKMTEEIVQKLRRLAGWDEEGIEAHHGSMNKQIRKDVEQRLKMGELRCCVSSSSLELGIDIGTVDCVVQLGSPGSIATALQRIGRASHHVGGIPRARFLPTGPHDLVELVALQGAIMSGEMDLLRFPENALDVLAQFMVGLTIVGEQDIDEVFELITTAWPYRALPYDDYIEVIDMLEDEKRLWVDWEENTIGKRGYSQMIYYTNLGTISPDNNYLVLNTDGSMIGQLSSSFVSSVRPGDVILLGGTTYRIQSIQGSRVNVTPVTGFRPTVPSWSGEALSRSPELSLAVLKLQKATMLALRRQRDPRRLLMEGYGLSRQISESVARFMEQHVAESFEVPGPNRIMMEQIVGGVTTYMVTTCRGRAFNMTLGYFFAGVASAHDIHVHEISFDENGFLIKMSDDIDPAAFPAVFEANDHRSVIERYLLDTQLFAKRFREVAGRSLIIPRRIGAEEVSPQQFQQKADALLKNHRASEESLLMKEVFNEIFHADLDMIGLNQFVNDVVQGSSRILHTRVKVPSPIGMNLYMSAFEDLLSMRTRAYLIKDIDPEILRRLLGQRALATQLDEEQVNTYYNDKVSIPKDAESLLDLMEMGGGLDKNHENPLYRDKLEGIEKEEIRSWIRQLIEKEEIVRVSNTGHEGIDN